MIWKIFRNYCSIIAVRGRLLASTTFGSNSLISLNLIHANKKVIPRQVFQLILYVISVATQGVIGGGGEVGGHYKSKIKENVIIIASSLSTKSHY